MTFGFKSFGSFAKPFSLFGNDDHSDGEHDGHRLFGFGGDRDHGRDHDDDRHGDHHDRDAQHDHDGDRDHAADAGQDAGCDNASTDGGATGNPGDTAGVVTPGTGWPEIAANTSGITFHVDYDGDGTIDNYIPIGRTSETHSFEDYLAQARDQVAADNPDVDPKSVIVKATITGRVGDETYYTFTGLEEDQVATDPVDTADNDEDDDSDDTSHHGHGHHADHDSDDHGNDDDHDDDTDSEDETASASHGSGSHESGDHDADHAESSCGDSHADFFTSLMCGERSFDHGHDDDHWADDENDDDRGDDDFDFC